MTEENMYEIIVENTEEKVVRRFRKRGEPVSIVQYIEDLEKEGWKRVRVRRVKQR